MKAWRLHGVNDLRFEDVKTPAPEKDEALLRVKAVGICGSDVPRVYQTGAHRHPLIIGHEFAGVVETVGPETDKAPVGMRAAVFPLIPCMRCENCKNKRYEMCADYDYLGSRSDGAFTTHVRVPVWNLAPIPDAVSFEAAAMSEPMAVAVHAMRVAFRTNENTTKNNQNNDTIVIFGAGTIGLLLAMFLLEAGYRNLFVVGNKTFQKERLQKLGLDETRFLDLRDEAPLPWLMERTGGRGVDVAFECVGKSETYAQCVDAVASAGRIVLVGNPYGDMALTRDTYWKLLRRQIAVKGVWNSSFTKDADDDWRYVLKRLEEGRVRPEDLITRRLPLERMDEGLRIMRDKTEPYCKIMIVP